VTGTATGRYGPQRTGQDTDRANCPRAVPPGPKRLVSGGGVCIECQKGEMVQGKDHSNIWPSPAAVQGDHADLLQISGRRTPTCLPAPDPFPSSFRKYPATPWPMRGA
jgi:hypothetical protein